MVAPWLRRWIIAQGDSIRANEGKVLVDGPSSDLSRIGGRKVNSGGHVRAGPPPTAAKRGMNSSASGAAQVVLNGGKKRLPAGPADRSLEAPAARDTIHLYSPLSETPTLGENSGFSHALGLWSVR